MYRPLFVLLVLFLVSCDVTDPDSIDWVNGFELTPFDDSGFSDSLKTTFLEYAATLTARDIQSDPATENELVELPENLINLYYNALFYIRESAKSGLIADSQYILDIQPFPFPQTDNFLFAGTASYSWINKFAAGETPTGYDKADNYIKKYQLSASSVSDFGTSSLLIIVVSPKALNISALIAKFQKLQGILFAEYNCCAGDGHDINKYKLDSDELILEYSFGYGDCPSGCIARHYWNIRIDSEGNVSIIEEHGDPLPQ